MHEMPLIIWKNYSDESANLGSIGTNYIGLTVLKEAGIPLPKYYKFLDHQKNILPAYTRDSILQSNGNISVIPSEEQLQSLNQQWILQYDSMFGKSYGKDQLFEKEK